MNIIEIPLDKIDVGDRLREVDQDYVALIAASMAENGQRTAIEVRPANRAGRHVLIAGAHRVAALKLAGLGTAFATVLKATDLEARLLEIDENLCRRELSALDRATFLAQRKSVYEEMHPETRHGGDRRSDQVDKVGDLIGRFTGSTAERLGLSERSIQRAITRYDRLAPPVRAKIGQMWLADSGSQLDALAKLAPSLQGQVTDYLLQHPGVRSVGEAVRQIEQRPEPAPASGIDKLQGAWRKATARERQHFLAWLVSEREIQPERLVA